MQKKILPIILLIVAVAFPLVHADPGTYVIPLEGSRWASSIIQVHISGGQVWQQNLTLQAMQVWNRAQLWFAREYFQNASVYMFEEGGNSAPVQVTLLNSSSVVGSIQGWTDYHAQNGVMESAKVKIGASTSKEAILILSVHELGHVLGLGHVSCCVKDLMESYPVTDSASFIPTTLDLYAVHILASTDHVPKLVLLPNAIPYKTVADTEVGVPEFPNLLCILVTLPSLMLIRRRR